MNPSRPNPNPSRDHGIIAWFARNHVAANLLMAGIMLTGLLVASKIKQEVFPSYVLDTVRVDMDYRGASPEEVERAVVLPIESEVRALEFVKRLESRASEGRANVTIEITPGFDRNRALQEVTAAMQRISIFPDEVEPPVIALGSGRRRSVMSIAIYGDLDDQTLLNFARQIEDGLLAQPEVAIIRIRGYRRPEIHVLVPQEKLRALDLTLDRVARAIDGAALDLPAGTLKTESGDILLKTTERRDFARQFEDVAILSRPDGGKVRLTDIATIEDGFEETEREAYFNGKRAMFLYVYSAENQPPLKVAAAVREFIEREQTRLPEGVHLKLTRDRSQYYQERLTLLLQNGALGLILVLLALGTLLELKVAFWTAVGIPVSILGSIVLLPLTDSSINMISLFGFIVTLGIVVDDAVVVGEDIFHKMSQGMSRLEAAVAGVRQMTMPVVFAVCTNIIAFLPMLFVPGSIGQFFKVLPSVVIAVFTVSLVECLFILPAHLAFSRKSGRPDSWFAAFDRKQTSLRIALDNRLEGFYRPFLDAALRNRALTVAMFVAALGVVLAYVMSGRVEFAFRPTIETNFVQAEIQMPSGTPLPRTRDVAFAIEAAAHRTLEQIGEDDILVGVFTTIADRSSSACEVSVTLVPQSQRQVTGEEFANLWREQIGTIPDVEAIFFDYLIGPGGQSEIDILLAHPEVETLRQAANDLAEALGHYSGVEDISKGFGREMPQLNFEIKPEGRSLGITARDLGRQIRHAFYGAEALRQPRGREELRVMVKLPDSDRRSMSGLENLLILVPGGGAIPISQAAEINEARAPVRIQRVDGGRVINVRANVIPGITNGNKVIDSLSRKELPGILSKYPGLRHSFEGDQREQGEAMQELTWGLAGAVFVIFAIMASLLRSYVQALIVLLTIPWSLAGAVLGHVLLGFDLSIFSVFGMIALCGMVVNGAFVMAVTRNRYLDEGRPPDRVTAMAAMRRFRPIFLTAVTTFLGLGPMIFETSIQALFLVPMAISLGVGTLVSSIIVLILIPTAFSIMEQTLSRRQVDTLEEEIGEEAMSGQPVVGLTESRQTTSD